MAEIARAIDPGIKVAPHLAEGLDRYEITLPIGAKASIFVREPSPWGPHTYGNTYDADNQLIATTTERPGANRDRVPDGIADVWVDVSKLKRGEGGNLVYAIAGALAHNTSRIFIGDPNGVSDDAMQRRPEQMLSLALRWGTTEHIAPHPRQLRGDPATDMPPLKWVAGDDLGNIQRLVVVNLNAMDNRGYGDDSLRFDLASGSYRDASGQEVSRADIMALAASGFGRGALAGGKSLARAAVLRALLREPGGESGGVRGRDGLLARIARLASNSPQAVEGLFSRGVAVGTRDAEAIVARVKQVLPNAPEVVLLDSVDKAPEGLRAQIYAEGAEGVIEGAYHEGTIYGWPEHWSSVDRAGRTCHEMQAMVTGKVTPEADFCGNPCGNFVSWSVRPATGDEGRSHKSRPPRPTLFLAET